MLSEAQIAAYQAPENLLAERVIMITGAGDGIGKTAALRDCGIKLRTTWRHGHSRWAHCGQTGAGLRRDYCQRWR